MANRTPYTSPTPPLKPIARKLSRHQNLFAVWLVVLSLLIQQTAIARNSRISKPNNNTVGLADSEAGSTFIDSRSGARIVQVTDARDGEAGLVPRVSGSSFNADATRFIVNLDGAATIYDLDPSSLRFHKRAQLSGGLALQSESCQWSAVEPDRIIALEAGDAARIYAYDLALGSYTLLKDFSGSLGPGAAAGLSKSRSDDNSFCFSWQGAESSSRMIVIWDRVSDSTYFFDLADPLAGVPGFQRAYLNRSGEALIVDGEITRVWRYLSQPQSEAIQLERNGNTTDWFRSRESAEGAPELPREDVSPDGRFSIFPSQATGSRTDVFIAALTAMVSPSNVVWTNMVNCTASGNTLIKTGGVDQADDAHATSAQAALSGDAYVEFEADQTDKEIWCGLNNSNAIHQSAGDMNYAVRLAGNKKAVVVENGVVRAKIRYKAGNVFRVSAESGVVNYYKNGSLFYTSTARPSYPLLVNASLIDAMSSVSGVMVAINAVGAVVSISPARASMTAGETKQFTALVTGANDTITWSATGGAIGTGGLYTAPAAGGTYTVKAACASNPDISASATVVVSANTDTTPPVISGVAASNITASGVTISWNTNEPGDTQVEYGTTSAYGAVSTLNPALVTGHSVAFGGLASGQLYHYRVRSKDAAGNLAVSGDFAFTTTGGADTIPPVISAISVSGVTADSATISWTTNEASDTQVEYGITTGYGKSTGLNTALVTSHSAFISGLSSSTTYNYRVKSRDAAGNLAVSGNLTFTTSAAPAPPAPAPSGVITNKNVYPEPAPPSLPPAGGTFVDPTFGTTIMRVTDENDGASNYNYYSYWPTFNLDSTRFFIARNGSPTLYRFDPNNFQILSKGPLFDQVLPGGGYMSTEDAIWSGTNPNVLYSYYGLKVWAYDVAARTYTMVKDFTGELSAGYLGQMSKSIDDNVFAFTKKDTNWVPTGYIVWQRDTNRVLRNVTLSNYDEVELDKTGRYLVVKAEFGGGIDFQVVDLQTGAVQSLTDPAPDYSPGHSDNGRGIVVGHDNWNNQYTVRSLAAPHQFQKVISFGSDWSQANHVSMLANDEGWCLISNFTAGSGPVGPFRQEIFQASTDGNQNVRRLAHHHSVYRDYWDTPRANISRDGRFVAFTSNWGSTSRRDVFIIRVPQGSGSGSGSGDSTPPVISSVAASSITSSSASISWSTNEASDTQVEYGTTTGYGSATAPDGTMVTSHNATIAGLSPSTLYHYRVRSKDAAGNQAVSGDFTFTTASSGSGGGGGGSSQAQNVAWTSVVNCLVSANSLQKNSGRDDDSDAGAISQQQIVSGDGYVQFTAGVTNKIRFCGLTHNVSGTSYAAIDFAIKLTEFGVAEVRENNVYKSETPYSGSDVFRVSIEGGVVKYYKNGAVFYTSGIAPSYPLRVDAAFLNLSGTVNNAVIGAGTGGALAATLMRGGDAAQPFDPQLSPNEFDPRPLRGGLTVDVIFHRRFIARTLG
jgi:hypothetical protein